VRADLADARFTVDPAVLGTARSTLLDVGSLLIEVRLAVAAVRASSGVWGDGGILAQAVTDLVATLDEAARRCQDDVIAVSDAVGRAAHDYGSVENGLTVRRVSTVVGS